MAKNERLERIVKAFDSQTREILELHETISELNVNLRLRDNTILSYEKKIEDLEEKNKNLMKENIEILIKLKKVVEEVTKNGIQ